MIKVVLPARQNRMEETFYILFNHKKDIAGRFTTCLIETNTKTTIATGLAECHENDNFRKETGRKLALKRALESVFKDPEDRKVFWDTYRSRPR